VTIESSICVAVMDGPGQAPGELEQVLLHHGHLRDGQLDAQVAAGDHHAVRHAEDLLGVVDALRLLDLGDERRARVLADEQDVLRGADEAQRDHVDADLDAGLEVLDVLLGHGRQLRRRARDVQALPRGDGPADLDLRVELARVGADRGGAQADAPVGQVEHLAGGERPHEPGPGHRDPVAPGAVLVGAADERDDVADLQRLRLVGRVPMRSFGPGQVLQDRHGPVGPARRLADELRGLGVLVVRAVGEVQAGDVHPRADHGHEDVRVARGGADGGDDLRATRHVRGTVPSAPGAVLADAVIRPGQRAATNSSRASTAVSGLSENTPSTPRAKNCAYSAKALP
jgi:hypothetical protein